MLRASLKYSNIECSEGPTQDWQHPTGPINIGITFCKEEGVKTNRWKTARPSQTFFATVLGAGWVTPFVPQRHISRQTGELSDDESKHSC